jgi:hypothetical protein
MAEVKFLKIASNVPTEHDGTADDLTINQVSTDTINERTGAAGVTIDSVVLKDGGVNLAASSNYQINGVDIVADSAGTATLSNIDALDATTESTIEAAIDTLANLTSASSLTTVGALNSGSIATGFGNIDNGTSNITTGGILTIDVDGTDAGAAGSLNFGAGTDVAQYWDGDEFYLEQNTALTNAITYNTLLHETSGTPANGIGVGLQFEQETSASNNEKIAAIAARVTDVTSTSEDAALDIRLMIAGAAHATTATFDLDGLNLASGDDYSINGTSVLSATTLGSGVTTSSLTTVGTIGTGTWNADTIGVDYGGTGRASHTAYAVLCGGTTGTGAQQSIASVGSSGQVLTSNGAGALPTFQAATTSLVQTYTAASTVAVGDVVYMTTTNNEVGIADADTIAQGSVIVGLAGEAITATNTGDIHVVRGGILAGAISAATAGDVYYLSATGTTGNTLTTTAPSGGPALVKIGFAKNATDLVFDPEFIADTTA